MRKCLKFVRQRTADDCLTACIASLTGIPYEDCPRLWEFVGQEWLDRLREWSRERGLGLIYFNCEEVGLPIVDGIRVIACGATSRTDKYDHCVIAVAVSEGGRTNFVYEFDPAGADFIISLKYFIAFIGVPS